MGTVKRGFETNVGTSAALTNGQTATTAASGSTTQAGGTQTYATAAKYEGSLGLSIATTAVTTTISRFALAATTSLQLSGCAAFVLTVAPTSTFTAFLTARTSGSGTAFRLIWKSTGTLWVRGQGTTTKEVQIPGSYSIGTQYVVTFQVQVATATTGSFTVKIYNAATKVLVGTVSGTDFDFGTTAFNAADFGFANSDPQIGQKNYYDAITLVDGSLAEVTPDSWVASGLAGFMYDGTTNQPGIFRTWDGTTLNDLASVAVV